MQLSLSGQNFTNVVNMRLTKMKWYAKVRNYIIML
jgi:hypothetical protein